MLIHIGKALNVPTQEEIDREYYTDITRALDEFFSKTPAKARLDKAILAEMIGRVGIKPSVKPILKDLLEDPDENVRQFALQSLEYHGSKNPRSILPVIEKFRKSDDQVMVTSAAYLTARLACSEFSQLILSRMARWYKGDSPAFVTEILKRMVHLINKGNCGGKNLDAAKLKEWTRKNCPEQIRIFSHR